PMTPLGSEVEDVANPIGSFWMSREFFATVSRLGHVFQGRHQDEPTARVDETGRGRTGEGNTGCPRSALAQAVAVEQRREDLGVGGADVGGADAHHGVSTPAV